MPHLPHLVAFHCFKWVLLPILIARLKRHQKYPLSSSLHKSSKSLSMYLTKNIVKPMTKIQRAIIKASILMSSIPLPLVFYFYTVIDITLFVTVLPVTPHLIHAV